MKLFSKLLATCLVITSPYLAKAQNGQKLNSGLILGGNYLYNECVACDSLGDVYMQSGDTSMALYYYQLYLEAHPSDEQTKNATNKFRKVYTIHNRSFYLKEY